jgi:hypothetical protein
VRLSNLDFTVHGEMDDAFAEEVPYPYAVFDYFDKRGIPHALYMRYVRDISVNNVRVVWDGALGLWRSALRCDTVDRLVVNGLAARGAPGQKGNAVAHLTGVREALFTACRADPGSEVFLRLDGKDTRDISVMGSELSRAALPVLVDESLDGNVVYRTGNREG